MRKSLSIFALVLLVGLSGCVGLTTYESPEPTVNESTLQETGYELTYEENIVLNKSVEVQNFKMISKMKAYERQNPNNQSIDFPPSQYMVISTPSVAPLDFQLNPIIIDPTDSTFDRVKERSDAPITLGDKVGEINETHSTAGNITIEKYDGTIEIEEVGAQFDAIILSSVIETDDAVLVVLSSYPTEADQQEEEAINMIKNTTTVNTNSSSGEN